MNGTKTIGENIADKSGFEFAYNAYKTLVKENGAEPKLPGLEKYSNEQMFWISFARSWCSTEDAEYEQKVIETNEHTVNRFRIIGVVQNSYAFSEDFQCSAWSLMNPLKKCEIW